MHQQAVCHNNQKLTEEAQSDAKLLKGKRALITGGTSGLGRQIALKFAQQGAHVAILGRNMQRAQKVFHEIEDMRAFPEEQNVWMETLNVASKSEVDKSVGQLIEAWGGVDVLVNNAGITRDQLFMRMKEADWDEVIDTNLKSVYNLCQAVIRPMMKARYGKIVNISSVVGLTGNPGQVNYAASKSGMIGLTKSLAKELASRSICINCIAPGFFETPMTDSLHEQQRKALLDRIPMKRFGNPEDIAYAALFLASCRSDYITGQVLTVDGGMLA
ncbi:MAG: 3-oxoacyl-[acyl-carrier-protein] reductase [Chlamydiota bacterium]